MNPIENSSLRIRHGNVVYIMSPPYSIMDLVLAYFDAQEYIMMVVQIGPTFYSRNNIPRRVNLLEKWRDEGRVLMQEGGDLPYRRGVGQQRWLYVFKNAKSKNYFLGPRVRDRKYRWIE